MSVDVDFASWVAAVLGPVWVVAFVVEVDALVVEVVVVVP